MKSTSNIIVKEGQGFLPLSNHKIARFIAPLVTLGLIIALWQMLGDDTIDLRFPTFTRTLAAFFELVETGRLPLALFVTAQTFIVAYAVLVIGGTAIGVLVAQIPLADRVVTPYFSILVAIPIIALVPVVQAIFGLSFMSRVIVIVLFGISYIVINTAVAVRQVDGALLGMARSFGARETEVLTQVVLPAAVPGTMAGIRLATGQALIGMVVAELTIVGAGIGSLIAELQGSFHVAGVLSVAMTVVVLGVVILGLVEKLERHLSRWSQENEQ